VEEYNYYPYGLVFGASSRSSTIKKTDYLYNGKELQHNEFGAGNGLELTDYGARLYDAQIGRWTQVDPLSENYEDWSNYNYVLGNPVNLIDPDGREPQPPTGLIYRKVIPTTPNLKAPGLVGGLIWFVNDINSRLTPEAVMQRSENDPLRQLYEDKAKAGSLKNAAKGATTAVNKEKKVVKSSSGGTAGGPRAGKPFTPKGKKEVWNKNKEKNDGVNRCENCEKELEKPSQSRSGEATPENAGQVDHIYPQSEQGDGSPSNGDLLCPGCNNAKSNNLPVVKEPTNP
jgi:RHS repeat-associated protein